MVAISDSNIVLYVEQKLTKNYIIEYNVQSESIPNEIRKSIKWFCQEKESLKTIINKVISNHYFVIPHYYEANTIGINTYVCVFIPF